MMAAMSAGCTGDAGDAAQTAETGQAMDSLVTADWLAAHLDDPDLVVLDCTVLVEPTGDGRMRSVSGRSSYEAAHIPSAGFADLPGALSDPDSALEFALPDPEEFAAAMGALGVGDDTRVVLYDASGSVWAARVWWMLRWIGFDRAALLDGGFDAWMEGRHWVSTDPADHPPRTLTVSLRPELIAGRDEVFAAIDDAGVELIDALPEAHYRGEMAMYARPGHIAGAVNVPVFAAFDESGRFRPQAELESLFDVDRDGRAITYCGGGIAASATAFVMTRLGFTDVAVYAASLQEWAADPANPMETATGSAGETED
jgi:thiosulfate/3-mercaptopyruvate sulfurtransferase